MALKDTTVIIAAAGSASRMKGEDKLLADLCGKSVIARTILAFQNAPSVAEIIIVTKEKKIPQLEMIVASCGASKVTKIVAGGETRQQSVINGLKASEAETSMIAVHDGARPLISTELIEKAIADARVFGGAALGVPVKDTVKVVDDGLVTDTPDRSKLYLIQTPQVFKKTLYIDGVNFAVAHELDFTDDCQLVEAVCGKIAVTTGDYRNIKITTPDDLLIARAIFEGDD